MPLNNQGITASDLLYAFEVFDGLAIARAQIRFAYDEATDCWRVHNSADDSVKSERPNTDSQWVEA